jgi:hypothetical protein
VNEVRDRLEERIKELKERIERRRHHIPVRIWVEWHVHHKHHHHRRSRMLPNLAVGQKVTGTVFEKDANGNQFAPPPANITVASADPTIVSIVANGDGTVTATGVAPGSTVETIGDSAYPTVTDPESAVCADVPVSIGVNWGTPA